MERQWYWLEEKKQPCVLLEERKIFGYAMARVWLPSEGKVVDTTAGNLLPISRMLEFFSDDFLSYVSAAGKLVNIFNSTDVLLSPLNSSIIPLPHQIRTVQRAITGDRIRFLLADEVGLGKTIEAGLIMQELKLRGLVKRILIVAPKGLLTQWETEMKLKFAEDFKLIISSELSTVKKLSGVKNAWKLFDQVICPMDSVKPLEGRQGWTYEHLEKYNKERFLDLISAGWDLIIVDEAHKLGGSSTQVARYKLGQRLSQASPYILLLSATPHQGKTDSFLRLMSFLDSITFSNEQELTRENVSDYVIRTEKRAAIDIDGKPLFKKRITQLYHINFDERYSKQKQLYDAVTEYVREGYNKAMKEKRNYVGFLMLLMQRLVSSSTLAISRALEKRLMVLEEAQKPLRLIKRNEINFAGLEELDPQEQFELLTLAASDDINAESHLVGSLLELAKEANKDTDAKANALLEWIQRLRSEELNPELKILVFTEFIATQEMLKRFLLERGFQVVTLNGSMNMEERIKAQKDFEKNAQIMISTDAGGEGLNLQFCHVVINYDMPWNPMKIEQRIGRVDRIGQKHDVKAINFVLGGTVEHRVIEVIENKLKVIFDEFGVDKTSDILDSTEAVELFDELYASAIANPDNFEKDVDNILERIRQQIIQATQNNHMLPAYEIANPEEAQKLVQQPVNYWLERAVISYITAYGGKAAQIGDNWKIRYPETGREELITFDRNSKNPDAKKITFNDPLVTNAIENLPELFGDFHVPVVSLDNVPKGLQGVWSLWKVVAKGKEWSKERVIPAFVNDEGKVFLNSAILVWDRLIEGRFKIMDYKSIEAFEHQVEKELRRNFENLKAEYLSEREKNKERKREWFKIRRQMVERIGLPQVREHRLKQLKLEMESWESSLNDEIYPELKLLLAIKVKNHAQ
ncbi:MAG: DEAD/DEAH box helicase family protein [Thermotogaceae bacterium]|nr:DEAD/DEAH box helicase family protein [Thermotogaceae bacterium]